MAKTGSYIKLDRGLKNNHLWLEKPFSKGQAWVDLLLLAQGVNREKQYRGKVQQQKSGVVYTSIMYLTDRWGWYRSKTYRFLENLIELGMIEIQGWTRNETQNETQNGTRNSTRNSAKNSTTNGTIITIEKWALYQYSESNNETNNETSNSANNETRNETQNETSNETHNRKHKEKAIRESNKKKPPKSPLGGLSPDGEIPEMYRDQFRTLEEYLAWRNQ